MAQGGLFDQVGGGFHRYTVDPTWTVPHFEKMLYVNAELASLYLEAAATFGEARYREVATATLDFLLREMTGPEGGFSASLDADSAPRPGAEKEEGAYYVFGAAEIAAALGEDAAAFGAAAGVTPGGNFEHGTNVLTRRRSDAELARLWARARPKLLAARERRPRPDVDAKVIAGWYGLAIAALAEGYAATGEDRYRAAAVRAAEHVLRVHRAGGSLARASNGTRATGAAALEDHAHLARGLALLFEVTGDRTMLEQALALVDEAGRELGHPSGGWYASRAAPPVPRRIEIVDGEEPAGASAMTEVVLRLASLTGRPALLEAHDRAERAHARAARAAAMSAPGLLDAALLARGPFYDVVVAGEGAAARALAEPIARLAPPWAVRATIPAAGAAAELVTLAPALADKPARGGAATAYVCLRGACKAPVSTPGELRTQLVEGWSR